MDRLSQLADDFAMAERELHWIELRLTQAEHDLAELVKEREATIAKRESRRQALIAATREESER